MLKGLNFTEGQTLFFSVV